MEKSIETSIQIRFVDIDQFGHVNNAVYLSYLEISRIPYFDQIIGKIDWMQEGMILGKIEIDYLEPILLNDAIKVRVWCSKIGNKSFELSYLLLKISEGEEKEMAKAKSIMVCFNYIENKSILMPEEWIHKLI